MQLTVQIVAIIFMLTMSAISIMSFILLSKIFYQLKYKNYLMEKLTQNIYMIASKNDNEIVASKAFHQEENSK